MKSLIYGYGETGKSFERYLIKKNLDFEIYDQNIIKYNKKCDLRKFDQILCSPGIPLKTFNQISKINQNVITDVDIFFNEDDSIKIGITGTNRKSTTAFHLQQLFENFDAANLIGNIGNTMLDFINNGKNYSIIELSSFQLNKMTENKLDYGILLNIDIDHIDYHGNFESYKKDKEKILLAKNSISYETDPYKLFEWITKIKSEKIELKNLPFRCQKISENIINDSKSTNFHSLSYALNKANNLFKNSEYILIVCGDPAKEGHRKISIEGPQEIFIFGNHRRELERCIKHSKKTIYNSLEDIFNFIKANKDYKNILFSPGYPSGKDFKNFVERGECFNQFIKTHL